MRPTSRLTTLLKNLLLLATVMVLSPVAHAMDPVQPGSQEDSLDVYIGQMLVVGFRGTALTESSPILQQIRRYQIGGVVLFDYDVPSKNPVRNISSPDQVRSLTRTLRSAATLPLMIAVDQEGGRVNRLKPRFGFPPSQSAARLGGLDNSDSTKNQASLTARTLRDCGISCNFAPVVDVNRNPDNPVIGKLDRSFSSDPEIVIHQASLFIEAHRDQGVLTALKHFPGHGSSSADSHEGFVDVTRSWSSMELTPFARLIQSGSCDMIMTAHIFNANLDPNNPATLSKNTLTGLLRDSLHYDGVIVSDDMQMRAITSFYGLDSALCLAINAGVDMFIFGNNVAVYDDEIVDKAITAIQGLVRQGKVTKERLRQSFVRIQKMKSRMGF